MLNTKRSSRRTTPLKAVGLGAIALASTLVACGGGGGDVSDGSGTLRLSITDAPACGLDKVYVTVEKVRVHQSGGVADTEGGWREIVLPQPQRVDLLSLTNGALQPLGETQLPAGKYSQIRLVLAENTAAQPLANAVVPTGGVETPLTTPSGQQSGLKLQVHMTVPEGKVAEFAIDMDACKSIVRSGNAGRYSLKPVISVIPILSDAGQRIVGYVDPALVTAGVTVSAQQAGTVVRATPVDATGKFTLYPVPAGTYDLVLTAKDRVNGVITGVPVADAAPTTLGTEAARLLTPASGASYNITGTVSVAGSTTDTQGVVRAMQTVAATVIETGSNNAQSADGAYTLRLPSTAAVRAAYAASTVNYNFAADAASAGKYSVQAKVPSVATPRVSDATLNADVVLNFGF